MLYRELHTVGMASAWHCLNKRQFLRAIRHLFTACLCHTRRLIAHVEATTVSKVPYSLNDLCRMALLCCVDSQLSGSA